MVGLLYDAAIQAEKSARRRRQTRLPFRQPPGDFFVRYSQCEMAMRNVNLNSASARGYAPATPSKTP